MSRANTFEAIRKGVTDYREKGGEAIPVDQLLEYLDGLEAEMDKTDTLELDKETEIERIRAGHAEEQQNKSFGHDFKLAEYNWKKESSLAKYGWDKDSSLEMFKSVIEAGQNSMRAAMLMHGGASVALLAFIGNLAVNADTLSLVPSFGGILPWYLGGLLLVVIAYGTTYLTQNYYSEDEKEHVGKRWNVTSCLLVIVSYLAFIIGSWIGYQALMGMASDKETDIKISINSEIVPPVNSDSSISASATLIEENAPVESLTKTSPPDLVDAPAEEESSTSN